MFVQERQEKIIQVLQENAKVLVKELSEKFSVTDDCIRKDLAVLEKKNLLKRVYGGAVLVRKNTHLLNVQQRKNINIAEKKIIAQKAKKFVQTGDVIFLDISTANIELIKILADAGMKITVITNMIAIMNIAASVPNIELIFIGGVLNSGSDGFVGTITNNLLKKFHFDSAFIGTVGIDIAANAVYTYKAEDGYTKKTALQAASKVYMMAETAKFSHSGNFRYADITEFNAIITEKELSEQLYKKLQEYQIEVI
ncbi:DeoR/GlpR family DNA-binding transcription regulator [Pectinatus brassicae]|uniref:DeoR family glycerol-3-phosphate regulon repressor n=1 Tax=Pectinatus brassicae TaxID=862415 RepID=A0A840ULH0_9FIRM|nr:DeoR/GlpR family DNA-binding transcription regulator [Pectinatus brassicae]MBB5335548.1 DeoR family glycerol-3-phosphate regulon repressor [Pectinatus brassicae]